MCEKSNSSRAIICHFAAQLTRGEERSRGEGRGEERGGAKRRDEKYEDENHVINKQLSPKLLSDN